MNAKCQAIRDAQLVEKSVIKGELSEEEKRLDDMMEVNRLNGIKMEEEISNKLRQERLIGAKKIMDQISENEQVFNVKNNLISSILLIIIWIF